MDKLEGTIALITGGNNGIGLATAKQFGAPLKYATASKGAVGIGALAVGDVKYNLQQALLRAMLEAEQPVYLDFRDAFQKGAQFGLNKGVVPSASRHRTSEGIDPILTVPDLTDPHEFKHAGPAWR